VRGSLLLWPVFICGVALDLWSKHAVFAFLEPGRSIRIIDGVVQFVCTENPGAAFGIAAGQSHVLVVISVIALAVILGLFYFTGSRNRLLTVALALFAAGVTGNLYDRLFNNGMVRDFIDVTYWPGKHWPAFNVADSMLCVAVGLILISSYLSPRRR